MEIAGYLIFVAIMVTGSLLGLALREKKGAIRRVEWLAKPVIFLLLFIMGLNIGLDETTMNNLLTIGLSSLGFAVLTVPGSMLVLALVLPFAGKGFARKGGVDAAIVAEGRREGEALPE